MVILPKPPRCLRQLKISRLDPVPGLNAEHQKESREDSKLGTREALKQEVDSWLSFPLMENKDLACIRYIIHTE
jgi:hypothetical protein